MNASDTMVGWVITKTHDDDGARIGYGQTLKHADDTTESFAAVFGRQIYMATELSEDMIPYEHRVKWRSFSDDGDPAYDGVVHIDWLYAPDEWEEEHSDLANQIDTFVMTDWGATVVVYNASDIRRCKPEFSEYVAKHPRMERKQWLKTAGIDPTAWLPIYG
jgi:hypothetical protein